MSTEILVAPDSMAETQMERAQRWPFSVTVVIPAYNEEPRVAATVKGVRAAVPDAEIIVVDDASRDGTGDTAERTGAQVIRRGHNNGGPGAPIKAGVRAASGDVIVIIDCDGQHDPNDIPRLLQYMDRYDMVIAERPGRTSHENFRRYFGNLLLNKLGSYLIEMEMKDLTSGLRAMRRSAMLEFLHLLPNGFSWAMTSALSFAKAGYTVRFEPISMKKRQGGQSTQKLFKNGIKFGMIILRMISLFAPLRVYAPIALSMFVLGMLSWILNMLVFDPLRGLYIPNSALALLVGSVIVFLYGLQAESIASLRFKGPDR
jgi:glycosyltransferase involved in cell wall biosynthesis